jgi:hypothetical protein
MQCGLIGSVVLSPDPLFGERQNHTVSVSRQKHPVKTGIHLLTMLILPRGGRGVWMKRGVLRPVAKMADTSGFRAALFGVTVGRGRRNHHDNNYNRVQSVTTV